MFNRPVFFNVVRDNVFGGMLTQRQVEGMDQILDEWESRQLTDLRWLGYMLGTAFHETARTMQPVKEYGGREYHMRMYDVTGDRPALARSMGNTEPGDGALYCGRGFVQITWKTNYAKASKVIGVDLVKYPDRAMEPGIAAQIMFHGMIGGWFTGQKLQGYFNAAESDWRGARRIINGLDKADEIAAYSRKFYGAAMESFEPGIQEADPLPEPVPPPPPPPPPKPPSFWERIAFWR